MYKTKKTFLLALKRKYNGTTNMKSLVISAQDSTGNAGDLLPFWNEYTQEESRKWWLPEKLSLILIFFLFLLLLLFTNIFLLGTIVLFRTQACGMDL